MICEHRHLHYINSNLENKKIMKKIFMVYILCVVSMKSVGQVGIGTSTPHASAKLDIVDNSRGILIPRMTMAQRVNIVSPALGLMVFQTDNSVGFWYYDGTQWNYFYTKNSTDSIFLSKTPYREGFASSTTWTCPSNITSVVVEVWGAGGSPGNALECGGGGCSADRGGNGGYVKQTISVVPGNVYNISVGTVGGGGVPSTYNYAASGGSSSFAGIVTAAGGGGGRIRYCSVGTPSYCISRDPTEPTNGAVINFNYQSSTASPNPAYMPSSDFLSNLSIPTLAGSNQAGYVVLTYNK